MAQLEEVAEVRSSAGDMEPGGDGCSLGFLWGGTVGCQGAWEQGGACSNGVMCLMDGRKQGPGPETTSRWGDGCDMFVCIV